MKLVYKRTLIFFSVALNIGFMVMALFHTFDRAMTRDERRWEELTTIVRELNLTEAESERIIEIMADFRKEVTALDKADKTARMEALDCLTWPEPLDQDHLHECMQVSTQMFQKKQELFEFHVLIMRRELGNEKGAEFFSRVREHILATQKKTSHR
ncbi:hypothetical protein [Desulfotignum balticum]|uniref:hypothetical protein n=1 Tax=Desulfotignum balticum TaxID=115781 RepID=UPI0003FBED02|nr:hypothetical protein [Desulfotignum balticum]